MMGRPTTNPRIALIGCGAIAENFYLPALAKHKAVMTGLVLVDTSRPRAQGLADRFRVDRVATDHLSIAGDVDGAIVAVPPQWHYPIAKDLLSASVHVLCEKPLTVTREQGQELVDLAQQNGVTLSVNNTRRLFPASQKIKDMIDAGELGRLQSIQYIEGSEFAWPAATGSYFNASGGQARGVLLDRGAHVLDLVCWWLGTKPRLVSSQNDSHGGVECVAHTSFEHEGCACDVKLSWLTKLKNMCVIQGEKMTISHSIYEWRNLDLTSPGGSTQRKRLKTKVYSFMDFADVLLGNFLDVLAGRDQPIVKGADVLDSVQLISECYEQATRFAMPWNDVFKEEPVHHVV